MKKEFKRNLLFGFGASLVILVISSSASYYSIRNLLESAGLVKNTNEIIHKMNDLGAELVNAETGQRGFLLTGEREFLAPYTNARTRATAVITQIRSLIKDDDEQQSRLDDLSNLIERRFHYLNLSISDREAGNDIKAENLRIGREIMTDVHEVIDAMEMHQNNQLILRTESMNRFAAFTPPLIIFAALIALLITVLFYIKVRADFEERERLQMALQAKDEEMSGRISIIRGIADEISKGSYNIRIDDKQSDALGNVAGALNKMAESLEYSFTLLSDKEWLQTGLSKLNDVVIGEHTVENLSNQVINFLASYTQSHFGVLYIMEGDVLQFGAGFAYMPGSAMEKIRIGEALVGQAVASRRQIELKNVADDNIYITFTSGQAKPNHIIAVPIFDGQVIKGAIEMATLQNFTERDIEFFNSSAQNIGIALSTAQNRKRLQELLEETQTQSEELQTQHNELENVNSELEVQAEKLQASEEELKVQQEELRQANEELEERSRLLEEMNQVVTERNIDIQNKVDQLAQSTKYKSEFLANMSHELRTPLNSILLLSRLMHENPEKNLTPDQIEYANVIQSSGNGLLALIDEILDLSKIESGKMELDYQAVKVREIVDSMHAMFDPVAREKNIEFQSSVSGRINETIETDKLRLEQIIRNLLSNAIKFTEKGKVSLKIDLAENRPDHLCFMVQDTGIGIPKEKHSQIFEAFQQADGSTRRKYGGTGLGLSISRELVKLLGGELLLKSDVGKGSEFIVIIPISRNVRFNNKVIENEPLDVTVPMRSAPERKYISSQIPESIPDDRRTISYGDKVMLIIEDDTNFAKSLLDYTRNKGYKGLVSVRGDEGIELAKEFLPVGILLDIQLPVKNGWEVMEELKSNSQTRHIPVHIMSSYELKSESLLKGAVDFINKPVAFEQIQEIFKKLEYVLTHHPKKVLIVEENAKHAKALAYFLESFDVNLEITNDVEHAIKALSTNGVDCVILDMGIPDQRAYDTLEAVKKTPGLESLPIIVFTGTSLSKNEELKIKRYADSIVVKTAHSYKRILDEVSLFLHLVEKDKNDSPLIGRHHKLGALDEVLKNKTVLLADDDMRNIFSITKALEKYQMRVIPAVDGKDALQKLRENPGVDIVLMDMMMPEMDGYESISTIRKDRRFEDLPVIAVTAKAMMGDRAKCISAGASDYISKPVDIDQLYSLLRVWLYERRKK